MPEMKSIEHSFQKGLQEHFSLFHKIQEGKRKKEKGRQKLKGCSCLMVIFLPLSEGLLHFSHNEAPLCCINRQLKLINQHWWRQTSIKLFGFSQITCSSSIKTINGSSFPVCRFSDSYPEAAVAMETKQ